MIVERRVPHAVLMTGAKGVGKLSLALALSKRILCDKTTGFDSCNACQSCLLADRLEHPDLHLVFPVIKLSESVNTCKHFTKEFRDAVLKDPYISVEEWMNVLNVLYDEKKRGLIYAEESDDIIEIVYSRPFLSELKINPLPLRIDDSYKVGDVNSDGAVNAGDAFLLKSYVIMPETSISSDAADINADGKANSKDVYYLKGFFSGALDIADFTGKSPVYSMNIGGFPVEDFDIVLPENTDPDTSNAYLSAQLLKTYIEKSCGAGLSVVYGESGKAHGIYYHPVDYDSPECEELGLGLENYRYNVSGGNLHIYGSVRGNMYATYEILEKYFGLRFYSNEYTYAYNLRRSDIPEGTDAYYKVPYEFRYAGSSVSDTNTRYTYYFALGCNGTPLFAGGDKRDGYLVGPRFALSHSFGYFKNIQAIPMPEDTTAENLQQKLQDKYMAGNAQSDNSQLWQPCCTSDEEYYRMFNGMLEVTQMIQNWGANIYTDEIAKTSSYAATFSINDSGECCGCKYCYAKVNGTDTGVNAAMRKTIEANYTGEYTIENKRVYFKKEGKSGLFLDFMNRAAKEIVSEYHGYDYTYGEEGEFTNLIAPPCEGVRTVYPEMNLNMIIYDHTVPETVRPLANEQIMYVSHGCYNHILGTGECGDGKTVLGDSNKTDEYAMGEWAKMCREAGASIWYYSHGINYACHLAPAPNIPDFYYNARYLRELGFNGILYEGDSAGNEKNRLCFENLKAYLAAKMAFNPDITYEEFTDMVKEYMYMYYGEGYEEVYQFMLLQTAAGDAAPCWVNNHDRPFDEYEPAYIKEHYEEMRALILTAIEKADGAYEEKHCRNLLVSCDFLGLTACYKDMYTNGTAESRKVYEERYTNLYNYIKENELATYSGDIYPLPATIDYSSDPMVQLIKIPSWRGVKY